MLNPFQAIKKIEARRFTALPPRLRKKRRTAWSDPNRQLAPVDSFLEGPSFDRKGNLWCVDIPFGRIFRISPKGEWDLVTQYDGWPNGLKFHKDGHAYIAVALANGAQGEAWLGDIIVALDRLMFPPAS